MRTMFFTQSQRRRAFELSLETLLSEVSQWDAEFRSYFASEDGEGIHMTPLGFDSLRVLSATFRGLHHIPRVPKKRWVHFTQNAEIVRFTFPCLRAPVAPVILNIPLRLVSFSELSSVQCNIHPADGENIFVDFFYNPDARRLVPADLSEEWIRRWGLAGGVEEVRGKLYRGTR